MSSNLHFDRLHTQSNMKNWSIGKHQDCHLHNYLHDPGLLKQYYTEILDYVEPPLNIPNLAVCALSDGKHKVYNIATAKL